MVEENGPGKVAKKHSISIDMVFVLKGGSSNPDKKCIFRSYNIFVFNT